MLSDEIAKLKKEGDQPKPIDFSYYLSEWADKYGVTPEQVKAAFDQWAKAVENSEDYRTLGLRAFYQKNFAAAAENFEKAARHDAKQSGARAARAGDTHGGRRWLEIVVAGGGSV